MADNDFSVTLGSTELFGVRASGARVVCEGLEGWGSPASTVRPQQRPRANGAWAGDGFLEARSVAIGGKVIAPSVDAARAALDEIASAATLTDTPLTVTEGNASRTVMARRAGEVLTRWLSGQGNAAWSVQMVATDPRKTSGDGDLTGTTGLPMSSGGLTVPFTVPFAIESTVVSGQVSLANPGNVAGKVVLRIDGPVTAPQVTHVASGRSIVFAASLTIPAGNFVLIDMEAHQVLENGTASRNGWVTGRGWSSFEPGPNTWAFSAATHSAGTLTVTATPSWA